MAHWSEINTYQMLVARYSLTEFVKKYNGLFLLGQIDDEVPSGKLDFNTGVINIENIPRTRPSSDRSRTAVGPGTFLVRIAKKQGSAWAKWISIGRASNNDVIIRHPSVSKFHARLDAKGTLSDPSGGEVTAEKQLWITDNHSTKGTALNGKRLDDGIRYPLQLDDRLTIGDIEMLVVDAASLYQHLTA